jgi:hypothetical protein
VGCDGRDLKTIAGLDHTGWLTFYGKFEAAFQDIRGFDTGMSMARSGYSGLNFCFN